jgi:hypothetical protein
MSKFQELSDQAAALLIGVSAQLVGSLRSAVFQQPMPTTSQQSLQNRRSSSYHTKSPLVTPTESAKPNKSRRGRKLWMSGTITVLTPPKSPSGKSAPSRRGTGSGSASVCTPKVAGKLILAAGVVRLGPSIGLETTTIANGLAWSIGGFNELSGGAGASAVATLQPRRPAGQVGK